MSSSSPSSRAKVAAAALAAALLACTMPTDSAAAKDPAPHVRKYVETVKVQGQGRLTWFGFHVYDAQLYAGAGFDTRQWAGQPFVLELTYARKLDGGAIAEASRDEMQRMNLGTPEEQARWLAAMRGLFPNVDKGRRIAGVNVPGRGARFYVDGQFAGSVDEPAFARAFFSIWLDERTRAPKLRENLLASSGGST